jgi:outer membrane lipoprotein-sorting protein
MRFWKAAAGIALVATAGAMGWRAPEGVAAAGAQALLARVKKLNDTTRKWTDRTQHLKLTIVSRRGSERHREVQIQTKKYGEDASRSLLFFLAPAEVRGVGILQWLEPEGPDRQWLYLPALKRVRQITGASKHESFVGTDFSYDDLAIISEVMDWSEQEAPSAPAGDETVDGHACAVIDREPTESVDVGYGRIRLWLDRDELVVRKLEFYDTGRLEKTLLLSDISPVGRIPSAHQMEMRSERGGSHTVVEFEEIRYDTGLKDDVFSERRLERGV